MELKEGKTCCYNDDNKEHHICYDGCECDSVKDERINGLKRKNCFGIVAILLIIAFVFILGLIIGAIVSSTIIGAFSAVIVLSIAIGIMLILSLILTICNEKKYKC